MMKPIAAPLEIGDSTTGFIVLLTENSVVLQNRLGLFVRIDNFICKDEFLGKLLHIVRLPDIYLDDWSIEVRYEVTPL